MSVFRNQITNKAVNMNSDHIAEYLKSNLTVELLTEFEGYSDNQTITVKIKIGETVIAEDTTTIYG